MAFRDLAARALGKCVSVFGDGITYTPNGGSAVQVRGIFDIRHEAIDPETGAVVSSNQVTVGIKLADWPQVPGTGDTFEFDSVTYRLAEPPRKDGLGGAVLFLHRNS